MGGVWGLSQHGGPRAIQLTYAFVHQASRAGIPRRDASMHGALVLRPPGAHRDVHAGALLHRRRQSIHEDIGGSR
jgi:hypothetical protein